MTYAPWLTDSEGRQWRLEAERYLIGREAPCELLFPLPRLSRQHALLTRLERSYYLGDLHSRNGTFVNGQAITTEAVRLKDGDQIVLGGVLALAYHDPGETVEGPRLGRLRGVWLDPEARAVWVDARPVTPALSAAQFALLQLLYQAPGRVFSRAEVIAAVWPGVDPAGVSEEAVDGLIKRTRARLRETAADYVEVLRGQGLRLSQPE